MDSDPAIIPIFHGKIPEKSASVPENVPQSWLQTVFPEIRNNFAEDEVFNADEMGLLFKAI